jgi:energy-converting hydrogenase Eha subunit H
MAFRSYTGFTEISIVGIPSAIILPSLTKLDAKWPFGLVSLIASLFYFHGAWVATEEDLMVNGKKGYITAVFLFGLYLLVFLAMIHNFLDRGINP